jgi:hypothetical protein
VDETGLSPEAIVELILKTLYVQGARSGQELVDTIRLPFPIVDEQVLKLQHHRLVEVKRTVGAGRGGYIFDLTGTGAERAREAMAAGQYVVRAGAARTLPHLGRTAVSAERARDARAPGRGVLWARAQPSLHRYPRPAVNSAKSLFIFGDPGTARP